MPRSSRPSHQRDGFSLLEVILSIAVLFASVIALAQLASIGRRHANRAESLIAAQVLCQNKLNEIVVGLSPLSSATDLPFYEAPGWVYSVDVQPSSWNGLIAVKVSVAERQIGTDGPAAVTSLAGTSAGPSAKDKPRFSLVRWVRVANPTVSDSQGMLEPFDTVQRIGPTP